MFYAELYRLDSFLTSFLSAVLTLLPFLLPCISVASIYMTSAVKINQILGNLNSHSLILHHAGFAATF